MLFVLRDMAQAIECLTAAECCIAISAAVTRLCSSLMEMAGMVQIL